jgi:hypothetical protein
MRTFLTIVTAAAILAAGMPSVAAQRGDEAGSGGIERVTAPAVTLQQGGGPTLDQAVEQVRRQCKGRIVGAETRVSGGREMHVIKCLTGDGKVRTFRIPGRRV